VIVIDTGPVVAAANRKDDHHEQCVEPLQGFPGPLLLPAPLVQVTAADASRAADLIEQYSDLPLGTADAIVTRSGIHTAPVTPAGRSDITANVLHG
jgi:uncharacterized protein